MDEAVKPRRPYDSSRRREQARQSRNAVLKAARNLFVERGYGATSIPAIASEAGVAVPTVYKGFGNKAGLLKAVFDVSIVGDNEPVPMLQREMVKRIEAESDPRRKFSLYGNHLSEAGPRAAGIQLVAREAAASDADAREVWEKMLAERLTGVTEFARHLHSGRYLREGVSVEEARDVLWALNSVELYELLVLRRGWTPLRYGNWVAAALSAALLA